MLCAEIRGLYSYCRRYPAPAWMVQTKSWDKPPINCFLLQNQYETFTITIVCCVNHKKCWTVIWGLVDFNIGILYDLMIFFHMIHTGKPYILDGKKHGFRLRFPLNQSIDTTILNIFISQNWEVNFPDESLARKHLSPQSQRFLDELGVQRWHWRLLSKTLRLWNKPLYNNIINNPS